MIKKLDLNQLMAALHELDDELDGKTVIVRAVGGFALAWHNVRADGLTADIDSLTDDFPADVRKAIAEVGERRGMDKWWLNNDVAADDAQWIIDSYGLSWELVDDGFRNIALYVADLESLLKLKLAACEDGALSGRTRDLDDTIKLLLALGLTKERFKREYSYMQEEQPNAFRMICSAMW